MRGTGLIETMRARGGRLPLLDRHMTRLKRSLAELGLPAPPTEAPREFGEGDRVVRLEVREGRAELTTRELPAGLPAVIVATEPHAPYPHKTTDRGVFERALAEAQRVGADDALLVTPGGTVAEGTAWSLFWWDGAGGGGGGGLCTPGANLGVLPGVGRGRVMELSPSREVSVPVSALAGTSLFLVNAVRGIVPLASFQGRAVPEDPRTAALSRAFWPD